MSNNPIPNSKPFTKGDARINRKGRPKSFDALRALAQQIAQEAVVKDGQPYEINGHVATNIEIVLRAMMQDKRTMQQFVEIAFGKVPQSVQVSGKDGGPIETANITLTPEERARRIKALLGDDNDA